MASVFVGEGYDGENPESGIFFESDMSMHVFFLLSYLILFFFFSIRSLEERWIVGMVYLTSPSAAPTMRIFDTCNS